MMMINIKGAIRFISSNAHDNDQRKLLGDT